VLQKHIEAMETPYRRNIPIGCPHPVYGFAGTIPDAQYVTPTIYTAEAFKADVLALFGQEHGPETEETP
jgi:hypothetical protein